MPTMISLKGQVIECSDTLDVEFIRLSYREAELETLLAQLVCACGRTR